MRKLIRRHAEEALGMLEEIVSKSSGVFPWVVLACRSLISGFADYDRLPELRRRIDELPSELEDMFQHMLKNVKERHRQQSPSARSASPPPMLRAPSSPARRPQR